jgi:hypothetical protein
MRGSSALVAQTFCLLYRRLSVCQPFTADEVEFLGELTARSDDAECNSATSPESFRGTQTECLRYS